MRCWQKILSRVVTFYLEETIFTWLLLKKLKIPDSEASTILLSWAFKLFLFLIFLWNFRVTKKVVKRMCQNILARKFKDDDNYRRRATFHTFKKKKNLWFWNENEWCLFVLKGNIWRCIHNFDYHEHFTNSFSSMKSSTIVKKDWRQNWSKFQKFLANYVQM